MARIPNMMPVIKNSLDTDIMSSIQKMFIPSHALTAIDIVKLAAPGFSNEDAIPVSAVGIIK